MKKSFFGLFVIRCLLLAILTLPELTYAIDYFKDTDSGDVNVSFRKIGAAQEGVEMVTYVGNIADFLNLPAGTTTNLNNFQVALTNMCPDKFANLQWAAFSSFSADHLTIGTWNFTNGTCWYTIPRTNAAIQSKVPTRPPYVAMQSLATYVYGVSDGAANISSSLVNTNSTNNILNVSESYAQFNVTGYLLDNYLADSSGKADFNAAAFNYSVENTNASTTTTYISDFYQAVPGTTSGYGPFTDPITGNTSGAEYYVGYFTMNPNGSMTFTRAAAVTTPVPGTVTSTATNGFSPLPVTFTNTASGSITNWVWNFGDGTIITNGTGANVAHTYSTSGTYTVILTVEGPGGAASVTNTAFIVTSPTPRVKTLLSANKFIISGTNCPINIQYRILGATNLASPTWITEVTSTFKADTTFTYTNLTTNAAIYFKLVSP